MSNLTPGLSGYISAVPTPFAGERIDGEAFQRFCQWQIDEGAAGLVVNGTTGEAPMLSAAEQKRTIRLAREVARGRVWVIAGAGSNATAHAVELAAAAEAVGADAILAVTPYYVRPSQEGLYRHFRALHDAVRVPIVLYDVPSRTACSLATDTIRRLAELPRVAGLKDATGDLERAKLLRLSLDRSFRLLSGDDATALDFMVFGGDGCVSVLSNVAPRRCAELFAAWSRGDLHGARAIAGELAPLVRALFAESNPVPVKYALSLMGRMAADVRLPLWEAAEPTRRVVAQALASLGLLDPERNERAAEVRLPWRGQVRQVAL